MHEREMASARRAKVPQHFLYIFAAAAAPTQQSARNSGSSSGERRSGAVAGPLLAVLASPIELLSVREDGIPSKRGTTVAKTDGENETDGADTRSGECEGLLE